MEDVLKPPGSLLATDRAKAVVMVWFLLNVFGVGVSCRKLYSFVVYLYVDGSGSITSVGEERANLSAVVYLLLCVFCLDRFPLPLGAWDGNVILLWHSLGLPYNYFVQSACIILSHRMTIKLFPIFVIMKGGVLVLNALFHL